MIKFTFDEATISDLFKEAHGFRPSQLYMLQWNNLSDEGKQLEWDYHIRVAEEKAEREELEQAHAAAKLEERIADCISLGATDRETAIRWIADAEDCADGAGEGNGIDIEHLEWKLGVRYGYLKK